MDKTCATCRFWQAPEHLETFGDCDGIPYGGEETGKPAYYADYEGYSAVFRTMAQFGCVLWEGK